jgi:hypothetical protein
LMLDAESAPSRECARGIKQAAAVPCCHMQCHWPNSIGIGTQSGIES